MKRLFDVLLSVAALAMLAPLLALIALLIRVAYGSPVFFRQVRPGLHGKPFTIYKFRTMTDDWDENGWPRPDHQRLTAIGRFLRRTSLDEVPEFVNVIRGDMSLVGPRPLLMEYLPLYTEEQRRRHDLRPGMTGWAQIHGRNDVSWEQRFALDVWYVDNRTLWLDFEILVLTILKVWTGEGVAAKGHATVRKFNVER